MSRLTTSLVGVVLLALPALALAQEQDQQPPVPTAVPRTKPIVVPETEKNRQNPIPNVPEAIEAGRTLFSSQCAMCHGVKGNGKGDLAVRLKLTIPNLADAKLQRTRTDGELFYLISKGHGEMPAEQRLPDQNKWEMILYIRTLWAAPKPRS